MNWGLAYLFEEISKLTNVKITGIDKAAIITDKMLQRLHAEMVKADPDNIFAYPAYLATMERASRYVALPSYNRISQNELARMVLGATGISNLSNHNNGILAAIAIMRFQDISGTYPEIAELAAEVLSMLQLPKEALMPKTDLRNIYFGDSLEKYISNLIVPTTKNYAAIRAAYSKGHITCNEREMEEVVDLFYDLDKNVQEELFAMVASNVSDDSAINRARSKYALTLPATKNKVNDFIIANGDLIVDAFGLQQGLYSYDELRTLLALAILSCEPHVTYAAATLVENAFRVKLVSTPTFKKATPERVTTTPKTQTVKEIPMQATPTTITRNKDAMIHAARLEAGKTSITVLKALLKKSKAVPMAFRGYIDHPIADILLANLLVLTSKQVNNEKLSALADASMDASYVALAGSLNIQEMIEGFLATPEIASAIKAIEPKKD